MDHNHQQPNSRASTLFIRVLTAFVFLGLALVLVIALVPSERAAQADATDNISQTNSLNSGDCDQTEWHWIINNLDGRTAPAHIHVYFSTGTIQVPLEMVTPGGVAHYSLPAASVPSGAVLVSPGATATLEDADTWEGHFNLSHRPCATVTSTITPTNTPTGTIVSTNTPTSTPTGTIVSTNTPTSTPTGTVNTSTPTSTPTNTAAANTSTPTATATAPGIVSVETTTLTPVVAAEVVTPTTEAVVNQEVVIAEAPPQELVTEVAGVQATPMPAAPTAPAATPSAAVQGVFIPPATGDGGLLGH